MRLKILSCLSVCLFLLDQPVFAAEAHNKEHGGQIFHAFIMDAEIGKSNEKSTLSWDLDGWIGTDENKLWLKSEAKRLKGETEQVEFWGLYSRNLAIFWDGQIGLRHDGQPTNVEYLVLGVEGLAPYFFETKAHVFISETGDVSARFRQEVDLLITQKLILQPQLEINLYAQDVPEQKVGTGLSQAEIGLQARYEFTRKFAPYVSVGYERLIGETSSIAKSNHEDNDAIVYTFGIRLMF